MCEALSLLVYQRDPHSKGYTSISILFFSLGLVPILKVTYSPILKRLPFCCSIYVNKVMKLLAFIFEQSSYL